MKKAITFEQVRKYNQMVNASLGTDAYNKLALVKECRDDEKRWIGNPYGYLYPISEWEDEDGIEYYIKTVRGRTYLYMDIYGDPADRYHLDGKEIAWLFFGA